MSRINSDYGLGKMYDCKICGRKFLPRPKWLYRIKNTYYCSYTCWRKDGGDNGKRNHGL